MITLYHHPFCPHSRFIRLVLGEMGIEPRLVEEKAWDRRRDFLMMAPEGATPGHDRRGDARPVGSGGDRRISRRDAGPGARRSPADAAGPVGARRDPPAHALVQRQALQRSQPMDCTREDQQALHERGPGRRRAGHGGRARGARQFALSSALHRPPDRGPQLAGRRSADLCRPRGGGAPVLRRLSGRRANGTRAKPPRPGTRG